MAAVTVEDRQPLRAHDALQCGRGAMAAVTPYMLPTGSSTIVGFNVAAARWPR